jgi:transcriptional regulator PpsR
VTEVNPAAASRVGKPVKKIVGRKFDDLFEGADPAAIKAFLAAVQLTAGSADLSLGPLADGRMIQFSASLFRHEGTPHLLVRMATDVDTSSKPTDDASARLVAVIERFPDGFVVTDPDLAILTANTAFLDMAQLATLEQAKGEPLRRWLGRSDADLDALLANIKEHGAARFFSSIMRGELGAIEPVEISAVGITTGPTPCFGFSVRSVGTLAASPTPAENQGLPRSVKQMTELVGRVPLKTLVRDTTDIIERLCIEAALQLAQDNRVSAAEMLGLSRQSLYSKLRRYGIGELPADDE